MPDERPNPAAIMQLATGYWNAAALLAANELNLFSTLADAPLSAAQIAQRLQTPLRSTQMLLDACVGLALLDKHQAPERLVPEEAQTRTLWLYVNRPTAAAFLVQGRPGYLGDALRWSADQYALWGDLARCVREDAPAVDPTRHLGDDPEQTRRFVLGMHNRALGVARGVVDFLPFAGVTHLLDIGGGPGTYALLLAQKYPNLHVTVLDLPGVVAVAEELIAQTDLAARVQTRAGSALDADYGEENVEGVLFSGVLHQMDPQIIPLLFTKAYHALRPGGTIVISDIMLDESKTHPAFATLFSLQMLLTSAAGTVFSQEEGLIWLAEAGFTGLRAQALSPPLPYTVLTAQKPE